MTTDEIATASLQGLLFLARSPNTADEVLMQLAHDKNLDVRCALTERKGLSDQLMEELVNDKSKEIRLHMAKHPELKAGFQEILAGSREVIIRTALARRDDAPEDLLLKLAESSSWDVGMALLERKSLSGKLLNQLEKHKDMHVRMVLARREDLPEAILAVLFEGKSPAVVAAIAQRRNLSADQIEKLTNHKSKYVRADISAREDLSHHLIEKLSADKHVEVLHAIANRSNLSEQFIKQMLSNCSAKMRIGLAMKEPLPSNVIHELALDEDEQVRAAVAARSDISESVIDTFVTDSSASVRLAVACRSDLSKQKSKNILSQLNIDDLDRKELLSYIKKLIGADLHIESRKLVINKKNWELEGLVDFDKFGRLLPLVFLYQESKIIEEIVINIEDNPYSFDQQLSAFSNVKELPDVKKISLNLDGVDLSWARCSNLNNINRQRFPNLEKLSISYSEVSFKLDLPKLKEISITSSGDDFHEILLMLLNSNLKKLERISISAGCYNSCSHQDQVMKLSLGDAHEIWPNLKSLTIGARYAYDWGLLFTAPLFAQLDKLVIELDESYDDDGDCDDYTDACMTMMCKNVADLLDALIGQPEYLSNIGSITVNTGLSFTYGDCDLLLDKNKIARLKQLYNFNIEHEVYVGGYE